MIPYSRQSINLFDVFHVAKQLKSKSLTQGAKIAEFEERLANYVGAKYAVAVSSATAGLHLAVLALELPENSEIITSPISFVASANAILYSNHRPKFIDVERETVNLDLNLVEKEIQKNKNIKAVIPVHFAGLPCDMRKIYMNCTSKGVKVIEDAAHALGASYSQGGKVGSCQYSDMTVFSFHPVKSITTGEGGMVTTNSYDLYKKLLRLRSHGINKLNDSFVADLNASTKGTPNPWYYEMQALGYNFRLTEIQASLGISQLNRLDRFIEKRRKAVNRYHKAIKSSLIFKAAQSELALSAHHLFSIRIDFTKTEVSRASLMNMLKNNGIGSQVHYIPIPLHPYYKALGYCVDDLPEAMSFYSEALSIPLYPKLRRNQQRRVLRNVQNLMTPSKALGEKTWFKKRNGKKK